MLLLSAGRKLAAVGELVSPGWGGILGAMAPVPLGGAGLAPTPPSGPTAPAPKGGLMEAIRPIAQREGNLGWRGGGGEATGAGFSFIINANFYFTRYSPVPPNAHFSYSSLGAQREFCIFGAPQSWWLS